MRWRSSSLGGSTHRGGKYQRRPVTQYRKKWVSLKTKTDFQGLINNKNLGLYVKLKNIYTLQFITEIKFNILSLKVMKV